MPPPPYCSPLAPTRRASRHTFYRTWSWARHTSHRVGARWCWPRSICRPPPLYLPCHWHYSIFFTAQCCVFFIFSQGKGELWSPSNRLLIQQLAAGICGRKETPFPQLPCLPRLPLFSAHLSRLLLPCTDMFPQAVEHLAAAISVYPDQASLLQLLQSNLPPQAFEMLVRKLQSAAQEQADQITEQD